MRDVSDDESVSPVGRNSFRDGVSDIIRIAGVVVCAYNVFDTLSVNPSISVIK